jgi:hypothetical protein
MSRKRPLIIADFELPVFKQTTCVRGARAGLVRSRRKEVTGPAIGLVRTGRKINQPKLP